MKNLFIVASIALALSACSTTKTADIDPVSQEGTKYVQDFGKVEVTFTDNGQWTQIKSSATSAVPIQDDMGMEQAMNVATMRAKRNIVEFINSDVRSNKTTDTITKALVKNVDEDDNATKQRAANIATQITEKIAVESNGILKGVYVVERKVSSDKRTVVVVIQVDKRSLRAAQQMRASFGSN